jgi:putative (di)nucleoside polyphosphate hydrolase
MVAKTDLPYRPCAGIMLLNRDGLAFAGQRIDTTMEAWQIPQGGIDPGESAGQAAIRELGEEIGVGRDKVELIAQAPGEFYYDLPDDLVGKVWKGKWRGQRQTWFLYRFLGEDPDINLATEHPEFNTWRWVAPHELPKLIVPFKRKLYEDVIAAFSAYLKH